MDFPLKKFLSYYKPYLRVFFAVLITALIVSGIALLFPLLVRHITNDILKAGRPDIADVYRTGGLMLLLAALQNAGNFFVDYKGHEIGARMESDLRSELFGHVQRLPLSYFDKTKTGQLMSRITNDLLLLSELYHHGPEDYIKYLVRFTGAFFILFYINAVLTLAVFCFLPVLGIFSVYFNKALNKTMRDNKERIADVNAQVEDSLAGIRTVKSFANEQIEIEKFTRENRRFLESRKKTYLAEAYFFNGVEMFIQLITITVIVYGSSNIVNQSLDLADLITFLLYIGYMIEPMQRLTHMSTQFQEGITGFQRFMEIINLTPEKEESTNALSPEAICGTIQFRNVTFQYEKNLQPVLTNLNLNIEAGEYTALVGPSGSGKTTLCSLIPRLYGTTRGEILLDGNPVENISLEDLRRNIGIVHQDVYLFAGTVMENIRYGKPSASDSEVISAARQAFAHDFIMELPSGYHSEIGQRGVKLSGGQKQRLCIARAFLKNPHVLILDEATSALDNESEAYIKNSLEQLAKGRTTIVIAHRLTTIRNAGRIVVLTEEGIQEEGTHSELLKKSGIYARLYSRQFEMQI
ncbi:ABC transporter ATP-binding protein [Peribacillus sp. SCS-37]|uniref:ABC transporter ATP-binding protein n=1 Tax=Paraperibacillus esterisolvens TaxID=3115296 RepID=UPI003906835D